MVCPVDACVWCSKVPSVRSITFAKECGVENRAIHAVTSPTALITLMTGWGDDRREVIVGRQGLLARVWKRKW